MEIFIVVNACRDVAVVIVELVESDLSVSLLGILVLGYTHSSVGLKCLQELLKYLFLRSLAGPHVRVLPRVVALPDILDVNVAILVEVKLLEDALHQVLSERAHVTLDGSQQFIEGNNSIIIHIEQIKKTAALFLAELQSEIAQSLPELLYLECSVAIIVQYLEDSLQANQTSCAPRRQLFPQLSHQLIILVLDACVSSICASQ